MSKAAIERRVITILYDFQKARKVWGDLVSDGLTQANALVNVQLQQGYVDSPGYWPPALDRFLDLKERFEGKLQKRAVAIVEDFETTFSKMSAQYSKMKLQTSQLEYLMEEATETFGEAFVYRDFFGTTCTLEQIRIQLDRVFALYTEQIILNREILDHLVARNQHYQPQFISASASATTSARGSSDDRSTKDSVALDTTSINDDNDPNDQHGLGAMIPPVRGDKDQGMVLLSAWLNQPHLKTDVLATFDEFCQVELFGNET
ncbi:hypothetical protein BGZ65_011337 [Modicella reniformis]|uniref:Uncharacterized protein n=1 Tax=Modicella reniformis TaxID=1440133 RepID=A0A9P6M1V0_9FUNG|nr:hypothetical protein BGZ65_011337 [Modicella reniformis]